MRANNEHLLRWLRGLFYVYVVGVLLSVLALAVTIAPFSVGTWYTWAQQAVNLGVAVCLYLLSGRYRYAGILNALSLLCTLASLVLYPLLIACGIQMQSAAYMGTIKWLSRFAIVLSFMALILEYIAHAKIADGDKQKWYILLGCSLAITLVSNTATCFLQPIMDAVEVEAFIRISTVWNVVARTLSLFLNIANLVLLHRLIRAKGQEK